MNSNFACNHHAFTTEHRQRHFEVLTPALRSLRTSIADLSDGYEFKFASDSTAVALVAEWLEGERRCCPFLNIEVTPDPLTVRLTGPEGAKQFIRCELFRLFDSE